MDYVVESTGVFTTIEKASVSWLLLLKVPFHPEDDWIVSHVEVTIVTNLVEGTLVVILTCISKLMQSFWTLVCVILELPEASMIVQSISLNSYFDLLGSSEGWS